MWCKERNEYVEYENCEDCIEDNCVCDPDLPQFECETYNDRQARNKKFANIAESGLVKEVHKKLATSLCIDEEELLPMLDDFKNSICNISISYLKKIVKEQVEVMCHEYLDSKLNGELNKVFTEVLTAEIAVLQSDDKFIMTSIQEKLLEKTKKFFKEKGNYSNRDVRDELDNIISKTVEDKTEEALEELKKETIEKFNKEAMKVMLAGMAKQLGSDKRLMKILTSGEFE